MIRTTLPAFAVLAAFAGCSSIKHSQSAPTVPIAGTVPVDDLIQPDEKHFAHLWRITKSGENAEGYWSFAGNRLSLQRRGGDVKCDRIYVTDPTGANPTGAGPLIQISNGKGTTTCSYFMPGDRAVLFASTQAYQQDCPPPPDYSKGYVWALRPEFEIFVHFLTTRSEMRLTDSPGYDAEATVSPVGDRIVFTSMRTGDPELWTCNLDGSGLWQVTHAPGYDGGAFFSHDGSKLVFRSTIFSPPGQPGSLTEFQELIAQNLVRPTRLEIQICDADGGNRRPITDLGGASFAPYFFPDDARVIFATNYQDPKSRNFDLYGIGVDGQDLERITSYEGFDSFPMFSPDGQWLVFASNRGGTEQGETNLFLALWRD